MKVLGFRADPTGARFAIVESLLGTFKLANASTESRLLFPAHCTDEATRLSWLYREVERLFHENPDIARVVIKTNEFFGSETAAKRFSSYEEGVILLYCGTKSLPVDIKTYKSLSTNSNTVKADALSRVGQTSKYWDTKIADAIIAAWWGGK